MGLLVHLNIKILPFEEIAIWRAFPCSTNILMLFHPSERCIHIPPPRLPQASIHSARSNDLPYNPGPFSQTTSHCSRISVALELWSSFLWGKRNHQSLSLKFCLLGRSAIIRVFQGHSEGGLQTSVFILYLLSSIIYKSRPFSSLVSW